MKPRSATMHVWLRILFEHQVSLDDSLNLHRVLQDDYLRKTLGTAPMGSTKTTALRAGTVSEPPLSTSAPSSAGSFDAAISGCSSRGNVPP